MTKVRVKTGKGEEVIGEFMGIFQMSDVIPPSPMVGGHTGGVVAMPVAVVKLETGELKQSKIGDVIFDVTPREEPRVHEDSMDAHSYVLRQQERLRKPYHKQLTPEEIAEKRGDIKSIVYHETGKPDFYETPIEGSLREANEELMKTLIQIKDEILNAVNIQPPIPPPVNISIDDLTKEAIKAATAGVQVNHGPINPSNMTTEAVKIVDGGGRE